MGLEEARLFKRSILLSVKPVHVLRILGGEKVVELRRVRPQVQAGSIVVMYASSPIMAVVGAFRVGEVHVDAPTRLWAKLGRESCLSRKSFHDYFDGKDEGVALMISEVFSAAQPAHLGAIRSRCPDFLPPQSFRYIDSLSSEARSMIFGIFPGFTPEDLESSFCIA